MASTCDSEMDHSTSTTPPATPSRASTLPTASVDYSSASMGLPRMNNRADFTAYPYVSDLVDNNPPKMLMQTPITIECGPKLKVKLTLHEEIICCYSKQLQDRFSRATSMRVQSTKADNFRHQLAAYVFPEVTMKEFEEGRFEQQTKPLIRQASENYPLPGYASGIKKLIIDAVAGEIAAKNTKKTTQKPLPDLSLAGRLELLKPHAVQAVAAKLFARLHAINKAEVKKAELDPLKAAVQYRILLPDVEEATVRSLMQWIYRGLLSYEDSEQLFAVQKLASQLGVEALARVCLNQLYNAATDSLQRTSNEGVSLQTLLGHGQDAVTDDIVRVVFEHAVKEETTPQQLKGLIVNALATSLDTELWQHVKDRINHGMALQVIEAMVELRQHVETETYDRDSMRSEGEDASSASSLLAVSVNDKKPSNVGEQDEAHI